MVSILDFFWIFLDFFFFWGATAGEDVGGPILFFFVF